MSSRVEIVDAQQFEYPLRNLVTTLMLDLNLESELLTDEEVDGYNEGAHRELDEIAEELKRWNVQVHDATIEPDDGRDNSARYVTHLFTRGDEAVLMLVDLPEYCDDESDGYIMEVSAVMTLVQAKAEMQKRLAEYRAGMEKYASQREEHFESVFASLAAA